MLTGHIIITSDGDTFAIDTDLAAMALERLAELLREDPEVGAQVIGEFDERTIQVLQDYGLLDD